VNPLNALARRLGRHAWVMGLAPVIVPVDRLLHRVTRGRVSLVGLAGMPSLRLVTTGRKSGLRRENDLVYTPYDDRYVVIGSGWGRPAHPAWTLNLAADPNATVVVRGRAVPVVARMATEREVPDLWARAVRIWPGYEVERRLAGGREFRIFVLTARPAA
jgi:deazaflavin-dependent oxidoreductase (nitroreductase family)